VSRDPSPNIETQSRDGGFDYVPFEQIPFVFPQNFCLLGSTGSGKTVLTRGIAKRMQQEWGLGRDDSIIAWGTTVKSGGDYEWLPDQRNLFTHIDEEQIAKLWKTIRAYKQKLVDKFGPGQSKKVMSVMPHSFWILDDVAGDTGSFQNGKSKALWSEILSTARHYNVSVLFSLQHGQTVSPGMRANIRTWFVTLPNQSILDTLIKFTNYNASQFRTHIACARGLGRVAMVNLHLGGPQTPWAVGEIVPVRVPEYSKESFRLERSKQRPEGSRPEGPPPKQRPQALAVPEPQAMKQVGEEVDEEELTDDSENEE
jgi:hypothetical protein